MQENKANYFIDDLDPILRGFCSAVRSKDYYLFFKDVFEFMNRVQQEIDPGPRSDTYFLDKVYFTPALGKNWLKIQALYERGYAPIKVLPLNNSNETAIDGGAIVSRERAEYEELKSKLSVLYPPPDGMDEDIVNFARFFANRPVSEVDEDFRLCKDSLEVTCLRLSSFQSPKEMKLQEKDPRQALALREERLKKIKMIFAKASVNFVSGASNTIKNILCDPSRAGRVPFYAGESQNSIDAKLGGFHGAGLVVFMGGTSGFKTGAMSSIIANHCLYHFMNGLTPPSIWGYIGEDGIEAYVRRITTNILNRPPFITEFNFGEFSLGEFQYRMTTDKAFNEAALALIDDFLPNTHWMKPPETPEKKLAFSVSDILSLFDAHLESSDQKPRFIVLDYLNLLQLPRSEASGNRAQDLSKIAHLLDEWSQQKGIPIITAVQASVSGVMGARDMRFFEQEDIHECKSIEHHCRMMISLLPYTEYFDSEKPDEKFGKRRWMAIKVLKNRDGERDGIFVLPLNERSNITFNDSKYFSEHDWAAHKEHILAKKAEVMGSGQELQQQNHRGGRSSYGAQGGGNKGRGGKAKAEGVKTEGGAPATIDTNLAMADSGEI